MDRLELEFEDLAALSREYEQNLQHGRTFVPGLSMIDLLSDCTVTLVHPNSGAELQLTGKAVMMTSDFGHDYVALNADYRS